MKKVLILLVMIFTFALVGCDEATQAPIEATTAYDYMQDIDNLETDLQTQIDDLELQIELLQARIDSIVAIEGLNGNTVYYEKALQELTEELTEVTRTFDKDKAPAYIIDDKGDYVDFESVVKSLKAKYFGGSTGRDNYRTSSGQITLTMFISSTDIEMTIAEAILFIEELQNYQYYIISYTRITLDLQVEDGTYTEAVTISIPLATLLNDMFTVNNDSIMNSLYEIDFSVSKLYDKDKVKTYYDGFAMTKEYDGYVLNLEW